MIPAAPASVSASARGFTLLELMVVIIIIGIISSLAVLSLGDGAARRLDKEAYRFASLIRLAADEAVLQGREVGLEINRDGYAFFLFDDQFRQWTPMTSNIIYRKRQLSDGITMDLRLDDQELILLTGDEDADDDENHGAEPQVLLLSSGEITPFELIIEFEDIDRQVVLRAMSNGVIETLSGDEL